MKNATHKSVNMLQSEGVGVTEKTHEKPLMRKLTFQFQISTRYLLSEVQNGTSQTSCLVQFSKPSMCTIQQDTIRQVFPCSRLSAMRMLPLHLFMLQCRHSQKTSVRSCLAVFITAKKTWHHE